MDNLELKGYLLEICNIERELFDRSQALKKQQNEHWQDIFNRSLKIGEMVSRMYDLYYENEALKNIVNELNRNKLKTEQKAVELEKENNNLKQNIA